MVIKFRDDLGYVYVFVNEYGISFLDGFAYFTEEETGKTFKLDCKQIELITTICNENEEETK